MSNEKPSAQVKHFFRLDGSNHILFHVSRSDGWEYRWRQLGDDLPEALKAWSEVVQATGQREVIAAAAAHREMQIQWRKTGKGRWRQAALREMMPPRGQFRVRAKVDFQMRDFTKGEADLNFVALVRGTMAVYGADVDKLVMKAGEERDFELEAIGCNPSQLLFEEREFFVEDSRLEVWNLGPTTQGWRAVEGPAIACVAVPDKGVFMLKVGKRLPEAELEKLSTFMEEVEHG